MNGCNFKQLRLKFPYTLHQQSIRGNEKIKKEELEVFYRQIPNRKLPLIKLKPYLFIYYVAYQSFDTTSVKNKIKKNTLSYSNLIEKATLENDTIKIRKIKKKYLKKKSKLETKLKKGNWWMRVIGEAPSVFDTNNVHITSQQMNLYLKTKGYYDSKVSTTIDTSFGRNVSVKYHITENEPHIISQINYDGVKSDSIKKVVKKESLLECNVNFDESKLNAERERIYKVLKNNGYLDFLRQYISFEVDTAIEKKRVCIYIKIENPENKTDHTKYFYKDISIVIDKDHKYKKELFSTIFNQKNYDLYYYKYSPRLLDRKILYYKTKQYSMYDVQQTQNQLANMDLFRFVSISQVKDSLQNDSISSSIVLNSLQKYQISDEWGVNTNINQNLPGPFGSLTFTNRNIMNTGGIFDLNLRGAVEGQASSIDPQKIYRTEELNITTSLSFSELFVPEFIKNKYSRYNPKTRFVIGYTKTNRPEYERLIYKFGIYYQIQKSLQKRINIAISDINIIRTPRIQKAFSDNLENLSKSGNTLINSFRPSIVTAGIFNYTINNTEFGVNKKSKFISLSAELGGALLNITDNSPVEIDIKKQDSILGLPYFKFWKLQADVRHYFPVNKTSKFVTRFLSGIVSPYGNSSAIPYERLFFVGGSNSNRGWAPRRVGQGSFITKNTDGTFNYSYEKPGEIILETNFEYRFKIIKFFHGAAFVDAGNTWIIKKDESRLGAEFNTSTFLKEMAVCYGLGFRFDFTFIILRFDVGTKLWDPAYPLSERNRLNNISYKTPLGLKNQTTYNIGVGYPF